MPFDSSLFAVFFALVLLVYHRSGISWPKALLLAASYLFYASWSPLYLPFLWFSTYLDFKLAGLIHASAHEARRRLLLGISLVVNFGLLGFFKYGHFVGRSLAAVLGDSALAPSESASIFIPLGISFFTFQTVSYTVDVYRGVLSPCRRLTDFALYVTFFPQLVSGPIVRAGEFLPQLVSVARGRAIAWGWGGFLIVFGLFQKMVVADRLLAPVAGSLYEAWSGASPSVGEHWLGVYAFWGQLYADFSGYSNLAIGMGILLGFSLPTNFHCPHAASSIAEFWRRWHITLTRWFGDYVYIPLGGSRVAPGRAIVNVLIVMFLVGLWHGAAWTFVLWGLANAGLLLGERVLKRAWSSLPPPLRWSPPALLRAGLVYLLIGHTCILFRAHDIEHAWSLYDGFLGRGSAESAAGVASIYGPSAWLTTLVVLFVSFAVQWRMREADLRSFLNARRPWVVVVMLTVMLVAIWSFGGSRSGYIYFEF